MASLVLPASSSSATNRQKSKISNTNPFSFNRIRIPSWVSLNRSSSSHLPPVTQTTHQNQRGVLDNLHLFSLSKQGRFQEAREFLHVMDASGVPIKTHFYESLLEACGAWRSLSDGKFFHGQILRSLGRNPDGFLGNCLLKMYCDCSGFDDARKLFDEMPTKNSVTWGIMISAYAENGLFREAIGLFSKMKLAGISLDPPVFIRLVRESLMSSNLQLGRQIHSYAIRIGLVPDVLVDTALVNMYVKCGCLESSELVFDRMDERNAVTWTGLMVGYTQVAKYVEVLLLFEQMIWDDVELDQYVFSIVLKSCSGLEDSETGRQIHGLIVKLGMDSDVSAGTPLVDFYIKCGSIGDARRAFERISYPNEVSWSALISGYSQLGKFEETLKMFTYLRSREMTLNSFIYTSIFQVSSALADPNAGTQMHADGIKRGLISELYGESALVTMYSRSGNLDDARRAFGLIDEPDTVAWTAMIAGCAYHGHASEALGLFSRMQSCGVKPNSITFIGIFTACSHSGLVLEARQCLDTMNRVYGVEPTVDHFNCMVDIYCRSGRSEEAFRLINSGSFEPDYMTWNILLAGCVTCRNLNIGKIASENLLQKQPEDAAAYVLTFNLYASVGRWKEAALVRKLMNVRGIIKELGCSWITVKGKVHRFIVGDRHHTQTKEIYSKLEELDLAAISTGYTLPMDDASCDLLEERQDQLLDHSEKLAIAFGLISTPSNCPILVFKNLRVCSDCHSFTKLVSKITGREIVVRDSSRFHRFKNGECSCNNYW